MEKFTQNLEKPRDLFETNPEKYAELYIAYLGLKMEDLLGKKVLEIGSEFGKFAKIAKEKGVDIVTMEGNKRNIQVSPDVPNIYANAEEELPFKDETFDLIISRYAPPTNIKEKEIVNRFMKEIVRILKKDGKFVFSSLPLAYFEEQIRPKDSDPEELKKEQNALEEMKDDTGLPIETQEIKCQNINIDDVDKPEYLDFAYTIRKK